MSLQLTGQMIKSISISVSGSALLFCEIVRLEEVI